MGAIKITPDNVAPGNGPKYNVITIGASNGAQGLKAAVKSRQSIILWYSGVIADSRAFCLIIYFSACQTMSAEFIFTV